jgi:hypothetical protein
MTTALIEGPTLGNGIPCCLSESTHSATHDSQIASSPGLR